MQYRLQKNEKSAIRKQYGKNIVFKAIKAPCQEYEASAKGFCLSVEEVFYDCICALDDIREKPSEALFDFQGYWNDKYNEYRELAGTNADDKDIMLATSIVVMCVVVCLNVRNDRLYNDLTLSLIRQLSENDPSYTSVQEKITANIYRLGEKKFISSVIEYLESDDFISDEIDELLESVPQEQTAEKEDNGKTEKLTIKQLLIFLDTFLNVGFTTETTNVKAYSELVGLIAGENPGTIRSAMNRMKNVDYESDAIKEDVKYLAKLLEPVKPELANRMRKQIFNDD